MKPWIEKAHRVVARECMRSYVDANRKPSGGFYKRHRPYVVPQLAVDLVKAIGDNDEQTAKAIFVWEQ